MRYRRYGKECKFTWQTIYETCRNDREHCNKTVSNSIRNLTADEEQKLAAKTKLFQDIGLQIADTLGEMKGAVMKVGQIASQYKDIFLPEVAKAISKLQRQAPAMPFAAIQQQVERELGKPNVVALNLLNKNLLLLHRLGKFTKLFCQVANKLWLKFNIPVLMKPVKVT